MDLQVVTYGHGFLRPAGRPAGRSIDRSASAAAAANLVAAAVCIDVVVEAVETRSDDTRACMHSGRWIRLQGTGRGDTGSIVYMHSYHHACMEK